MIDKLAIILINYRDYAKEYLVDCIKSLKEQDFSGSFKIFIVDNQSTEETQKKIKEIAPEAELIINKENAGFAKGNNDGIKEAIEAGFDYFFLLNMDTILEIDCLSKLIKVASNTENWGAIQSRLMLWPEKDKVNSLGNNLHYLGFGFSAGGYQKLPFQLEVQPITYFSGAAVLLRKNVLEEICFFDEKLWMYHDDLDLGWKMRLAGYQIYLAPESVVYHKYQFTKSIEQYYWMERNRFICLLTNYKLGTLLLILPMLILMEGGLLLFSLVNGFWRQKFKVYGWLLNPKNWSYLKSRRQKIKKIKKIKDKEVVKYFSGKIKFQEIDNWLLKWVGNPILNLYWQVVRRLIFW